VPPFEPGNWALADVSQIRARSLSWESSTAKSCEQSPACPEIERTSSRGERRRDLLLSVREKQWQPFNCETCSNFALIVGASPPDTAPAPPDRCTGLSGPFLRSCFQSLLAGGAAWSLASLFFWGGGVQAVGEFHSTRRGSCEGKRFCLTLYTDTGWLTNLAPEIRPTEGAARQTSRPSFVGPKKLLCLWDR